MPRPWRRFRQIPGLLTEVRRAPTGPGLRRKTIQLYRHLMRTHQQDAFGSATVAGITEADIRRWPADMLSVGVTSVTAAKAYRLLKAITAAAAPSPCPSPTQAAHRVDTFPDRGRISSHLGPSGSG